MPAEFLEHTKLEMFQDQVFCFTPKGKLISLPRGATPIDFAYAVHSQVGDTCVGAKINGRMLPLRTQLAERRPDRDRHLQGADAVADLGALRRHRQGQGRDPPLHPRAPARAVPAARPLAARQDLPRGGLRGHRKGPRGREGQLQARHGRRPDRHRRRRPDRLARGADRRLSGPQAAAQAGRRRRRADQPRPQQGRQGARSRRQDETARSPSPG